MNENLVLYRMKKLRNGDSMGKVMLVTSGKGGTGKSTVAVNLALSLSKEGKKTVIIELDSGLRCLDLMLGVDDIVYDLADALNGKCEVDNAIYDVEGYEGLSVLAASSNSDLQISKDRFQTLCKYLCKKYDFVLLDTPAGLGKSLEIAADVSSMAFVVTNPSPVSIRDAEKASLMLMSENVKNIRLVINMAPQKNDDNFGKFDFDEIIDKVGTQLIAVVPYDDVLKKSIPDRNKKDFKKSVGITAFSNMAKRILGRDIPLIFK